MKYDVCIVGGGAAGLAAAASFDKKANMGKSKKESAKNKGLRICILEKNDCLGRKVLATGGGRCNLTNSACENKEIVLDFFKGLGLETRCDEQGRYYPYSERASDVVEILERALGNNVTIKLGFDVKVVSQISSDNPEQGKFMIVGREMIFADNVILALGGKAGPQFGTTGDGYTIAKTLGHSVRRVFPILTGIECYREGLDFKLLKGIRARGKASLIKDGETIASESGEIQFTDDGISGICVFNLTPYIRVGETEELSKAMKRYALSLDLAEDFGSSVLTERESSFGIVTEKLAKIIKPEELKNWRLGIRKVKGWRDSQATYGGVVTDDINMDTMESTLINGLYFAGEIINVQGPCGGFNLQNAWETGIKAAKAISEATKPLQSKETGQ